MDIPLPDAEMLEDLRRKYPVPPLGLSTYHAFISHSSQDRDVIDPLLETIEKAGFKCFAYYRDLPPNASIVSGVVHSIRESRRTISVVTPESLKSNWIIFEAIEAMQKGYSENQMVLVPILHGTRPEDLPADLKHYICLETTETSFWPRLFKALVEMRPSTALIPAGNVAHGLAWSYFYGYLKLVLPGLMTRCKGFKTQVGIPLLAKMVILLPESCNCPDNMSDVDSNISFAGDIPFTATRAGNVKRNYKSSVYKVTNPDTEESYFFIADFATPLLSMWEMEQGELAGLSKEQKIHQRKLFHDKLAEILGHAQNSTCHNAYTLLPYKDEESDVSTHALSRIIAEHIKVTLARDQTLRQLSSHDNAAPSTPDGDTCQSLTSATEKLAL